MQQEDKILFALLKEGIVAAMKLTYPGINPEIAAWKGQEITDFQEDLLIKVTGRLSEKWFYTHLKANHTSLPRIDVLNMLSKYAGYSNWDDFRFKNSEHIGLLAKAKQPDRIFVWVPLLLLATLALLFVLFLLVNTQDYRFTFVDADTGEPILNGNIQVDLLLRNESPLNLKCDKEGKLVFRTDQSRIKMTIRSPYYTTDTVERILKKLNHSEQVRLHAVAYALMIRYFSQTDVKAWQKRREQLDRMLGEDAMICQVPDENAGTGMELYNKQEFIDKLTMPVASLHQIEILNKKYERGKIVILRFKAKRNKK